jgi:hypothetical protein
MRYTKDLAESILTIVFPLILIIFIIPATIIGWVANIVKLFSLDTFSGELVIRVFGIFLAPLGAVLGFL